jgi:hypothetical protein
MRMHKTFNDVIWIVCGIGMVIALVTLLSSGETWKEYGKNALLMEQDLAAGAGAGARAGSAAMLRERDDEIRQMLEASNARRERRGEPPLDIEAELRRLTTPAIDAGLREEIRELVVARNNRRARRGLEPLDVEAEVEREISTLSTL